MFIANVTTLSLNYNESKGRLHSTFHYSFTRGGYRILERGGGVCVTGLKSGKFAHMHATFFSLFMKFGGPLKGGGA